MSRPPVRLAALFTAILAGPSGCTLLFGPCDPADHMEIQTVDAASLAAALADGTLSPSECDALCGAGTLSTGDQPTGGSSTSTGVVGDSTTTTGTTTTTTGTSDTGTSDTGTSTTGTSDTGTSTTSDTDTSTGGAHEPPTRARAVHRGGSLYPGELKHCSAQGTPDTIACTYAGQDCTSGRRPAGLRVPATVPFDEPGAWLAGAALLEAASVPAFERLADELRSFGAPAALRRAALAAADDERRHAAAMTSQARRLGFAVAAPALAAPRPRPLVALARENAVEGCVRETWAALLAAHQARTAEDPALRSLMAAIADDERRHAELAWAIDAWARTRLSPADIAVVDAARAAAAAALRPDADPPAALQRRLGLPSRALAAPMWRALAATLWAA